MCKVRYGIDHDTIKRLIRHKAVPRSWRQHTPICPTRTISPGRRKRSGFVTGTTKRKSSILAQISATHVTHRLSVVRRHVPTVVYSPDAASAQRQIERDVGASQALAGDDLEADLEAIANDDALLARLIELRSEN